MKKAKKNIILNNKDKSYDELFKLIQDDEEAKVKALLETRGVRDKLKLLSENNKTGLLLTFFLLGLNNVYGSTVDWTTQHTIFPNYFRNIFFSNS